MAQDTALVVDRVAVAAAGPRGLLDDAVEALGAGSGVASSVRATRMSGHQVWMVPANRMASGSLHFIHKGSARTPATEQVPGDALPDLGDHLAGEHDQVSLVDCDLGIR